MKNGHLAHTHSMVLSSSNLLWSMKINLPACQTLAGPEELTNRNKNQNASQYPKSYAKVLIDVGRKKKVASKVFKSSKIFPFHSILCVGMMLVSGKSKPPFSVTPVSSSPTSDRLMLVVLSMFCDNRCWRTSCLCTV
jgi:hypothetical protein